MFKKSLLILCTIIFSAIGGVFATDVEQESLAQCLAENNIVMYGNDDCIHCINQKEDFGNSFSLITHYEYQTNKDRFETMNITGTPTWIDEKTGERLSGRRTLNELAIFGQCNIVTNEVPFLPLSLRNTLHSSLQTYYSNMSGTPTQQKTKLAVVISILESIIQTKGDVTGVYSYIMNNMKDYIETI